ncbi:MAG: glutamate racemase [Clostridia bacterium]|nr:glutamate racemase [Clostridia bacterium]
MLPEQPIGIFDSGVGGLTVAAEVFRQLPEERIIYFGDTAHVPYGSKKVEELKTYADQIVGFLIARGAKAIIDACNTTSAVALPFLRQKYSLPIVGVIEPGVEEAVKASRNKRIGVIATEATVASEAHKKASKTMAPESQVFLQACPRLVPLIEGGKVSGEEVKQAVEEYLAPLLAEGIDTLILGCTHYPFLEPLIREIVGPGLKLIDPAAATVRKLREILAKAGALCRGHGSKTHDFFVSGDPQAFSRVGKALTGWDFLIGTQKVDLVEE